MHALAFALALAAGTQTAQTAPVPEGPALAGPADPRADPVWLARDRRLRRATIGTGAFAGAMALGLAVSLAIAYAPSTCDPNVDCAPEGNPILDGAIIGFGALTGVGVLVFAIVGGQLHEHREPLRRWRAALAPGGLQLRF